MFAAAPVSLAQATPSLFVWLIVLLVLLIGAGIVLALVRRRMSPTEDFHGEGFNLGDLRRLHQAGRLSDEEYEKAKQVLIASAQAAQARRDEEKKNLRDLGLR